MSNTYEWFFKEGHCLMPLGWEHVPVSDLDPGSNSELPPIRQLDVDARVPTMIILVGYMVVKDRARKKYQANVYFLESAPVSGAKQVHTMEFRYADELPVAIALCEYHRQNGSFPQQFAADFIPSERLHYQWTNGV